MKKKLPLSIYLHKNCKNKNLFTYLHKDFIFMVLATVFIEYYLLHFPVYNSLELMFLFQYHL